jgi:hypothetical protein
LISTFIPLWLDTIQKVISTSLDFLRITIHNTVWFVLEKIVWDAENVYSVTVRLNICRCRVNPSDPQWHLILIFLCWSFVWITYLWEWGVKVTDHYCAWVCGFILCLVVVYLWKWVHKQKYAYAHISYSSWCIALMKM